MINLLIRWLYSSLKYRQYIYDLLVEDFYAFIPDNLREPSLDFLALGKDKLEKAWSVQAYNMQRRSIMDNKNADVYKGILIILRAQLLVLEKTKKVKIEEFEKEGKVEDPSIAVEEFINNGKKRFATE